MKKILTITLAHLSLVAAAQLYTPNQVVEMTSNPSTGNVGIGTNAPQKKLEIVVSGLESPLGMSTGDANLNFSRHSLSMTSKPGFSQVPYIEWRTNAGLRQAYLGWKSDIFNLTLENGYNFLINGGNVGIGTYPLNPLDVDGIARFRRGSSTTAGFTIGGDALTLFGWETNNPYIQWVNANSVRQGYMGWNTNRLSLVLENGYNFTIENGNVGIGTASPDAKLTVNGDIHTREVQVDLAGAVAPDYVFEEDYNLRSLADLESYLKQNKHLPEVPSAKEFEEEGMKLKDMNLTLLKKVEEITLYMIAQQKQIEALKQENEKCLLEIKKLKTK